MTGFHINMKAATRLMLVAMILVLAFGTLSFAQGQRFKGPNAWSFGVMGDTQWTVADDPEGTNPEYVSAAIAGALQGQFISKGVRFVVQAGDLTDRAGDAAMAARALAAQPLFDAGIGFFPLRGNHETYGYLYGRDPDYNLNVPAFKSSFPQTQGQGPNLFGAANFSSPSSTNNILKGLSYAFDYNNASFVAVDVEQTSVTHQAAPNNPASCVTAITTGYGKAPAGSSCGQGYYYILSDLGNYDSGFTVFKAPQDIPNGVTNTYDSAGNQTAAGVKITIPAGTWFRIDSSSRPSTNFYAWDMPNPNQMYNGQPFDINDPIENPQNRISEKNSSANTEFWPGKQQSWISGRLGKSTRGTDHAFVFSHRGIIAENHTDSFFGADPSVTPADQNAFFASLANNGVKYMISAHDHLYNRALVSSPDGLSRVTQQITTGASTKFYTPTLLSNFPAGVKARETEISQELLNIGYYIYTVDGPRVTVDYYSDATGGFMDDANYPYGDYSVPARLYMPQFNFVKKATWGYSTNGKEFVVANGGSYAIVADSFNGTPASILSRTNARILGGINGTKEQDAVLPPLVDGNDRLLSNAVDTGWTRRNSDKLKSDILSLWGMSDMGSEKTDTFVLSLSFDYSNSVLGNGSIGIASLNAEGQWVNAVNLNMGDSIKKFVVGPYIKGYGLGTYGVDPSSKTAWAVINYNADFAVAKGI